MHCFVSGEWLRKHGNHVYYRHYSSSHKGVDTKVYNLPKMTNDNFPNQFVLDSLKERVTETFLSVAMYYNSS